MSCAESTGGSGDTVPGKPGVNYSYITENAYKYFAAKGMNIFRVPFLWERIQPQLKSELDEYNLTGLKNSAQWAKKYGGQIILDVHNYNAYYGKPIGSDEVSVDDFIDLWIKLSDEFKDDDGVYAYDLMNEPVYFDDVSWEEISQRVVTAIRENDDNKVIYIEGNNWSSAANWTKVNNVDTATGISKGPWIDDPADNIVYSAHCYFDSDSSGQYNMTYDEELEKNPDLDNIGVERASVFIDWCKKYNVRGSFGEYNAPSNDSSLDYAEPQYDTRWKNVVENFLDKLDEEGFDATMWSAGMWWGSTKLNVFPLDSDSVDYSVDAVMVDVLKNHPSVCSNVSNLSENVLPKANVKAVQFYPGSGQTQYGDNEIWKSAFEALTDGDTTTHKGLQSAQGWEGDPCCLGAEYALSEITYCSKIVLYGTTYVMKTPDNFLIYASDSLDNLYSEESFAGNIVVKGNDGAREITLNKNVQYVAILLPHTNDYGDLSEIELWTAENPGGDSTGEVPGNGNTALKVLTIGNSFTENTSIFATDIARASKLELTYAYIKYPACTISQHYQNATENKAVYKFDYTYIDEWGGTVRKTVTSEDANGVNGSTMETALKYMNWDIIVIQPYPSANEHKAADYADTANLISYVRRYCPTAKLALHEIWNWAWCDTDDTVVNDFANLEELVYKTAQANDIDIIIPTGRAFRFAIEDNDTIGAYDLITSDGIHAGTYGQYIAGACYVSTLFGIDITKNTFGDTGGDYASSYFDNYDLTPLRAAVAKAMGTSLGDVNRDGRIDADDIILVRKNLLGINISEYREIFMDANDDGEVDICDLVRLKKVASGMDIELKW